MQSKNYEVWIEKVNGTYCRLVMKRGADQVDTFESLKECEQAIETVRGAMDNKIAKIIERRLVAQINCAGIRPKAKDEEDPEQKEDELARKKGDIESPAGGFRLLKNSKKGDDHEDGLGSVGNQGDGRDPRAGT